MINCPVCGKDFEDQQAYNNHVEQSHEAMNDTYNEAFCKATEDSNYDYYCPVCEKRFKTEKEQLTHYDEKHQATEAKVGDFDDDRISISHYKGDGKWGKADDIKDVGNDESKESGAGDPLRKVDALSESWHTLDTEVKAKIFESLGINQGSAYTLANLDWYNLSPQLKKDASEAYAKEEDNLTIDNDEDLYALHKGLMGKPIKDDKEKKINEAYADIYDIEHNYQSPDFKKKAIECNRCNEKFTNVNDRNVHFNEVHATEQEYNLPEECPICKTEIKEPETLDYHMEQEHGAHIPSQYTQTGIQGAMAGADFDSLDTDFYSEAKATEGLDSWWDSLDGTKRTQVFDDWGQYNLPNPDSEQSWADYNYGDVNWSQTPQQFKNWINQNSYKYGGEAKANEDGMYANFGNKDKDDSWTVMTVASDLLYFNSREEAENYTRNYPEGTYDIQPPKSGKESYAEEDDMDDLQYRQEFGHDWWDEKARKERLKREGKAEEDFDSNWACPRCGNKKVKIKYDENGNPSGRECPKCGLGNESYANEEGILHEKCPYCNFETSYKGGDSWQETDAKEELSEHIANKHNSNESHHDMVDCPHCGKLMNKDKLDDHIEEEHGGQQ